MAYLKVWVLLAFLWLTGACAVSYLWSPRLPTTAILLSEQGAERTVASTRPVYETAMSCFLLSVIVVGFLPPMFILGIVLVLADRQITMKLLDNDLRSGPSNRQ
jgi:hypothetical protein